MPSTLPRRVVQAALPAATGAAPLIIGASAHAAELPVPALDGVTGISQPDPAVPTGTADQVGEGLAGSVLVPAEAGLGPALPITGFSADRAINSAMPSAGHAITTGTRHYLETNAAETLAGVTTPLHEVPQLF